MLKTDINDNPSKYLRDNLLEHHDYEAVSKEIYKNLKKWYNVDIDVIRFLKSDPLIPNKLFLDIYPEKRKKTQNSFDACHMKRNVWSMDYKNSSQTPNNKNGLNFSRNFEDYGDTNEFFSQNNGSYYFLHRIN